jgi:hypothetical protein
METIMKDPGRANRFRGQDEELYFVRNNEIMAARTSFRSPTFEDPLASSAAAFPPAISGKSTGVNMKRNFLFKVSHFFGDFPSLPFRAAMNRKFGGIAMLIRWLSTAASVN